VHKKILNLSFKLFLESYEQFEFKIKEIENRKKNRKKNKSIIGFQSNYQSHASNSNQFKLI